MTHKEINTSDWILIAKGIGILLVVIGHFNPESSPTYWTNLRSVIYSFHMPLFFLLSGYLYSHGKYTYKQLLSNKISNYSVRAGITLNSEDEVLLNSYKTRNHSA